MNCRYTGTYTSKVLGTSKAVTTERSKTRRPTDLAFTEVESHLAAVLILSSFEREDPLTR